MNRSPGRDETRPRTDEAHADGLPPVILSAAPVLGASSGQGEGMTRTLTEDQLGRELNEQWMHMRHTARRLAAQRLGVPIGARPELTREDAIMTVVLWREWLLSDREGESPVTAARARRITDDERAFAERFLGSALR